jgi:hypothetical protein
MNIGRWLTPGFTCTALLCLRGSAVARYALRELLQYAIVERLF